MLNFIRITLVLLSALFVQSCSVSQNKAVKLLQSASQKQYDVIVVPGIPFENGEWSSVMRGRVLWSKYLYDKGIAKNIMYTGGAVYSPYIESEIMAMYARSLGIPSEHIFTEQLAEHSTENIYYSYKKSKKLNFNKIALATDPFQSKMLKKFIRQKINADIDIIPFVFDTLKTIDTTTVYPVIDPSSAFVKDFVSITERESFGKRFRGTLGKSIDENAYE